MLFFVPPGRGPDSASRRHLNWTLKSLKVGYSRDEDQPVLESFTPPLRLPHSSLGVLLEGEQTDR